MKYIIAIYNKLDEESPYRSDIFDLFGTPDKMNYGVVGTKKVGILNHYIGIGDKMGSKRYANSFIGLSMEN